jgi:hypothetical protein
VRSRFMKEILAFTTAAGMTLALSSMAFSQAAPVPAPPAGQRGPGAQAGGQQGAAPAGGAQGGAQGGQRGGRGGRGGGNNANAQPAAPAPPTPRRPDGKPFMGSLAGQPTGRWSGCCTTLPQGQLDKIPFQPWAKAVYDQRQIDQFEPHTRCKASGGPRQFSTPYGTEMLEMPDLQRIFIMDEGGPHSYRIIYMDGRPHPEKLIPTNYGHSIGRWEGDTLVVDTVGFNEKFWLDTRGTPHTFLLHLTERFTRSDMNTMQYQATIDDPGAYTATWSTQVFTMRWTANSDLFEYICQDNNKGPEMMLGSQESVDRSKLFVP